MGGVSLAIARMDIIGLVAELLDIVGCRSVMLD